MPVQLRVRFWKFLVGVTIGEGAICAIYIYGAFAMGWRGSALPAAATVDNLPSVRR